MFTNVDITAYKTGVPDHPAGVVLAKQKSDSVYITPDGSTRCQASWNGSVRAARQSPKL